MKNKTLKIFFIVLSLFYYNICFSEQIRCNLQEDESYDILHPEPKNHTYNSYNTEYFGYNDLFYMPVDIYHEQYEEDFNSKISSKGQTVILSNGMLDDNEGSYISVTRYKRNHKKNEEFVLIRSVYFMSDDGADDTYFIYLHDIKLNKFKKLGKNDYDFTTSMYPPQDSFPKITLIDKGNEVYAYSFKYQEKSDKCEIGKFKIIEEASSTVNKP